MNIDVKPGKYLVAVSGGVDSMVLLDLLQTVPDVECVVAHFDHGIRFDSRQDVLLVQQQAKSYGCTFVTEQAELGPNASEAAARSARYAFLRSAAQQHNASAIITAHHQDDILETAIFNVLRGTGRRGLASLRSREDLQRPLLSYSKQQLLDYAINRNLVWREDATNSDDKYTRNYIRHRLLTRFDAESRRQLLDSIQNAAVLNDELDALLTGLLKDRYDILNRRWFSRLPHKESREVLTYWLQRHGVKGYDARGIERLTIQLKVRSPGTVVDVKQGAKLYIQKDFITYKI